MAGAALRAGLSIDDELIMSIHVRLVVVRFRAPRHFADSGSIFGESKGGFGGPDEWRRQTDHPSDTVGVPVPILLVERGDLSVTSFPKTCETSDTPGTNVFHGTVTSHDLLHSGNEIFEVEFRKDPLPSLSAPKPFFVGAQTASSTLRQPGSGVLDVAPGPATSRGRTMSRFSPFAASRPRTSA